MSILLNDPSAAPILSVIIIIAAYIVQHFTVISAMKERLKALEVKIEPFWNLVETQLPKLLHQDTTPRKDTLLAKMESKTLSHDEAKELKTILTKEFVEVKTKAETIAADRFLVYILVVSRLDQIVYSRERK